MEVVKAAGTPDERLIAIRKKGEFIGELSLINPEGTRMASVRTTSGARLWQLSRKEFDEVIHQNLHMAYAMVRELSKRLTTAHEITIRDLQKKNQELTVAYHDLKEAQDQVIIKERLEKELEVAHDIQKSILPERIPSAGAIQFGSFLEPARAVGGDFYDIIPIDKDRFGVMIGDVADKGVPSSLVMAQTHALIFAEASREQVPDQVLAKVNEHILEINRSGLFVTAIYGIVDSQKRSFHFARAGHEIPLVRMYDDVPELISYQQGQPLGVFDEPVFDVQHIDLVPGLSLLLYTDGLLDIRGEDGEQFGMDRLVSAYAACDQGSPQEICNQIWDQLTEFMGGSAQYDDVTMLVIGSND